MKLLPFEHIIYQSDLNIDEVRRKLDSLIGQRKLFRINGGKNRTDSKLYEGALKWNSFKINRIINYRTSLLPIIYGKMQKTESGTKLRIKMRLNYFSLVLMTIWFGGLIILCGKLVSLNNEFELFDFVPFAMMVFSYLLIIFGFKNESDKTKMDLTNNLKLKEIK